MVVVVSDTRKRKLSGTDSINDVSPTKKSTVLSKNHSNNTNTNDLDTQQRLREARKTESNKINEPLRRDKADDDERVQSADNGDDKVKQNDNPIEQHVDEEVDDGDEEDDVEIDMDEEEDIDEEEEEEVEEPEEEDEEEDDYIDEIEMIKEPKDIRRKIPIKYIENRTRRQVTFAKRRHGIMKKAYELSVLTGANILLLILGHSGLVYTFSTPKLEPIIRENKGKQLIRRCLNSQSTTTSTTPAAAAVTTDSQITN